MSVRHRVGIVITGDMDIFTKVASALSNRYDIVPIVDLVDQGLRAVVIPDSGVYNSRSPNVQPFKRIPSQILAVDNAYLLNIIDYWGSELRAVKTVALGMSALTVGDRMGVCKIHREDSGYSLAGATKLKTSLLYLNTGLLGDCIDEVIRFIDAEDDDYYKEGVGSPKLPTLDQYCDA